MSIDELRFAGVARLYGRAGAERLAAAHVAVVGIGGVGSWVAEALARSGVGEISLFDLDDVCISNSNRRMCESCCVQDNTIKSKSYRMEFVYNIAFMV